MRIRLVPILPLFGFVFCGHVFNSTANSENMLKWGEKGQHKKFFLCLPANCCQRFQSWASVGNFLFLRDYCMEIKKEKRKNQRQCCSRKSSYLQEKLLEILFNLLSQFFGNKYEIWGENTSQTPNRWSPEKTGAIPLHTQPLPFHFAKQYLSQRHDSQRMHKRRSNGKEV